jgi:hypothetical protein
MIEQRLIKMGDLAPPPKISAEELARFEAVIALVPTEEAPTGWSRDALMALDEVRVNYSYVKKRADNFKIELEPVAELGAAGPGRGMRVKATWIERADQSARETLIYPRSFKLEDIVYLVRNLLEHCFRV